MHSPLKILISGPVGSGKTTFVKTLADSHLVQTEAISTEAIGKPTTTVALDHGVIHLGDEQLALFGTPGQSRFDFMWDILSIGCLGLILMLAADRPQDIAQAKKIMSQILEHTEGDLPLIVVLTKLDQGQTWEPEDVADFLEVDRELVVGCDARDRERCLDVLIYLLELIQIHQVTP